MTTLPKRGLKTSQHKESKDKKDLKRDLKTSQYKESMDKKDLKRLSKSELIKMLLKKVHNHEDLLDNDPFKDEVAQREPEKRIKPRDSKTGRFVKINPEVPKPPKQPALPRLRDVKGRFISRQQSQPAVQQVPIQMRIKPPKPTRKPPPPPILQVEEKEHIINMPSSKIKELNRALKGYAKSYGIELQDNLNPLNHFIKTKALVKSHLEGLLKDMKGFKFIETLEVTFEKDTIDSETGKRVSIYKTAFFNDRAKTITKPNDIEPELSMSRQEIINAIDKWVSEGSGWTIDKIGNHFINVTTYQPLHRSSYIELPIELQNSAKGLLNIRNKDYECFRWCHIRHLNPQIKHPERIKKGDK